jgi:hypothetical protein
MRGVVSHAKDSGPPGKASLRVMRMKWKRLHSGRSPFKIHVMRATGTLSQSIARQVVESDFATLPPSTVHACKRSIIDGVATLLAGSGTAESEAFVDVARYMDSNGVATVFGYGERTSPVMAALCNGAMAHALDFEDAFDPVPSHPNASLLPAAFALSQYSAAVSLGAGLGRATSPFVCGLQIPSHDPQRLPDSNAPRSRMLAPPRRRVELRYTRTKARKPGEHALSARGIHRHAPKIRVRC